MSTTILSIESSCDETAAAIVVDGREVKSNIIYSQIELHKLYGGVVPEIASRKHVEKVNQVIRAAIEEAHVTWDDIDAVAVTYGPGLVGALLVGVSAAKARLCRTHTNQKCTYQSWSIRHCHGIDIVPCHMCFLNCRTNHLIDFLHMLPRCNLRHYAAIQLVKFNL